MTEKETRVLQLLAYETSMQEKRTALDLLADADDIAFLIRPLAYRSSWEFCAKALFFIEDARLEPHLPELLAWVEALNDEGSELVESRLSDMQASMLLAPLETFILQHRDSDALDWYYGVSRLAAHGLIYPRLSRETHAVLQQAEQKAEPGKETALFTILQNML